MKIKTLFSAALGCLLLASGTAAQQFQSKAEYDAYMALYNEQDTAQKIEFGESFIMEYPESEAAPIAYQILVDTHYRARDWENVVDVATRFDGSFPDASTETKSFIYRRAMAAAQQSQRPQEIVTFGERILGFDRNDLGALLTLPPVILDNLPPDPAARERSLARAFELAGRARLQAQTAYPSETGNAQTNAQRVQVFSSVHMSLGRVHYLRQDYDRAVREFMNVLGYDPRNPFAHLQLGLAYQFQAARNSTRLQQSASGDAAAAEGAESIETLEQEVLDGMDKAIESLASAVALGGQAGDLARVELEKLYASRHEDSTDGLEELIAEKRSELGAR